MKNCIALTISCIVFVLFSVDANAGGYLGASIGSTSIEEPSLMDDSGYKITGGIQTSDNIALEVSYVDLGEFSASSDTLQQLSNFFGTPAHASVAVSGVEMAVKGILPLSDKISIFGRLGLFFWNLDGNLSLQDFGSTTQSFEGNDLSYGIGINIHATEHLVVKAEFNRYDIKDGYYDIDYGFDAPQSPDISFDSYADFIGIGLELHF